MEIINRAPVHELLREEAARRHAIRNKLVDISCKKERDNETARSIPVGSTYAQAGILKDGKFMKEKNCNAHIYKYYLYRPLEGRNYYLFRQYKRKAFTWGNVYCPVEFNVVFLPALEQET